MRRGVSSGFRAHFLFWAKLLYMSKHLIEDKVREIAASIAEENKLELIHVETVGSKQNPVIRIFIDQSEGISHSDCQLMSRGIEAVLDADEGFTPTYMLEVSSPGLERELYSLQDFEKYTGNLAKVKTGKPINGQKNFRGRIVGVKGEEILFEDKTSGALSFPYSTVVKANLEIDLEVELKRK